MRRLAVALVALLAATPTRAQAPPDFSAVTALLQDSLGRFGGGEFMLMQHGRTLYRASFAGWDSTQAVPIASASKWLSGTVVMALVADGTLSLDDTVGRWLPDAPPDKRPITLRQLFAHTSGMPGLDLGGCLDDRTTTLDACARSLLALPLRGAPGEGFRYGGLSMQIAGRMAEVAAGQSFNALFASRVAGPLGLTRTDFGPGDNPRVAGGANSTAAEYARVLQTVLDGGGTLLTPAAVEAMLADQTQGAEIVFTPYTSIARQVGDPSLAEIRYGVGVWRERVEPATGADLEVASQGAGGFSPWLDRPRGLVAVLAVDSDLEAIYPTYLRLKALVRDAVGMPSTAGAGPEGPALALRVAPVPARDRLRIQVDAPAPGRLRLVDTRGRDVIRRDVPAGASAVELSLAGLAPGVYALHVAAGGRVGVGRVVVVR